MQYRRCRWYPFFLSPFLRKFDNFPPFLSVDNDREADSRARGRKKNDLGEIPPKGGKIPALRT